MEQKTFWKAITYAPRMDYLAFQANEYAYVAAVEKLLGDRGAAEGGLDADAAARAEPDPLAPDLARHRRARDRRDRPALVLLQRPRRRARPVRAGRRGAHAHPLLPGRRARRGHPAAGSSRSAGSSPTSSRTRSTCTSSCSTKQKIWLERTRGLGLLSADDAIALGQSGPVLRASGVDWDLRRDEPYLAYPELDFDVPVYPNGDVYDRYRLRVDEMRESVKIIEQCLEGMPGGAVDRRRPEGRAPAAARAPHVDGVADPPLQDRHRGLPRPGGRGLRRRRVAARRVRLLPRLRRRPEALARQVPRAVVRRAARRRRPACTTRWSPT